MWPRNQWRSFTQPVPPGSAHKDAFPILAAEPVLQLLRDTHEAGLAEIRWHTTWRSGAAVHMLAANLDLPTFAIAVAPEFAVRRSESRPPWPWWWKTGAARRVLAEEHRPLLWTDNDLDRYQANTEVAAVQRHHRAFTVSPQSQLGLITRHLRAITEWLNSWADMRTTEETT